MAPQSTDSDISMPSAWRYGHSVPPSARTIQDSAWWRRFGSGELVTLVQQAQAGSFDLAGAMARVRQAQALARIAGASLLPDVQGDVGAQRLRQTGENATSLYTAGLSASYELDLWGGNAAARQAALATVKATEFARDTVALTLTASVATTYLQTLALRERVGIAGKNLQTAQRILDLVVSQARAGAASPLDLAQQRGLVATQRQALAQREQQATSSLTALAMLLGRPVQGFDIAAHSLAGLVAPDVAAGVPSDLLTQRPDLAQAERQLIAAQANITVARAAMLPSLTLSAGARVGSGQLSHLFETPLYSLAAGLVAPVFNAGALAAGRDLAIAQREELLADYRQAIINAFGDVETALNAVAGIERQAAAQAEALVQAREAARLAESRYRAGAETLLTVLDAQRTLFDAQDGTAQLLFDRLRARVDLYKALGGGWQASERFKTEGRP